LLTESTFLSSGGFDGPRTDIIITGQINTWELRTPANVPHFFAAPCPSQAQYETGLSVVFDSFYTQAK
jgi:hypothetical protein